MGKTSVCSKFCVLYGREKEWERCMGARLSGQGLFCHDKEFGGATAWAKAGVKGNHEAHVAGGQEVKRLTEEVSRDLDLQGLRMPGCRAQTLDFRPYK